MAQNPYDEPDFFAAYSRLPRSIRGLDGAPEWPAVRALLPDLGGKRIVDLGCGFGWFARWAIAQGAAHVLGIDVSENMISRAKSDTDGRGVEFVIADLEDLQLPEASFDLAYSSLALHYVEDLNRLMETVHRALVPAACFVFTVEHPIFTAPTDPQWATGGEGGKIWPLDGYAVEGLRRTTWLSGRVLKQHRRLGTILNGLLAAGFAIRHVEEWAPAAEQLAADPDLAQELERPMFLLVAAQR